MSKLRLNGLSSGYVEIKAADTAANNTITLPSDTGSIIVQSITGITSFANAPVVIGTGTSTGTASQTLQVTGGAYVSGSVGVGTTNPTSPYGSPGIHVFGTTLNIQSTAPSVILTETDNSNNYYNLVVDGGTFGIKYNNGFPGGLQIDSSGRVTMPYQPAFQSYGTTQNILATGNVKVTFNTTVFNVGSHFSTTNNRFVAPSSGIYLFGSNTRLDALNMSGASDYHRLVFAKNGSTSNSLYGHSIVSIQTTTANYLTLSITGAISLSVNDYVEVFVFSNADTSYNILGGESQFWGHLIG